MAAQPRPSANDPPGAAPRYRILTLGAISPAGLARLPAEAYLAGADVASPDAILLRSQDLHALPIPPSVKAVGRAGAGTNNIPVAELSRRGVPVFNTPGANANAVKELVLAGLLLAARHVVPALAFVAALDPHDARLAERVEAGKSRFAGVELAGRTLGVVGLGAVGGLVADSAIKLGMHVVGFDPKITVDAAWRLPASVRKAADLDDLLAQSDFVSLHLPLTAETRHVVDARRLAAMRPTATLLNFARDAVVDEQAVVAALRARRLAGYVCDFPGAGLHGVPGVVALPHLGASTLEAEDNCAARVVDQVRAFLEHGVVHGSVNFPDVDMPRESPWRIAVANANVPNMLGQISTTVARFGVNIHDMLNKSRGELAYTLADVDSEVTPQLVEAIGRIDGVVSVRAVPMP